MTTLTEHYRRLREPRFSPYGARQAFHMSATSALHGARIALESDKIRQAWLEAGGEILADYEASKDAPETGDALVRIVCHPDEMANLEDLLGDSYAPEHNPDIKPEILEKEREAEISRIERDGVWGYIAEYWNGEDWEHADSIWGFVGNDFDASGYDVDLMASALEELDKSRIQAARALEASRPDMYAI